MIGKIYVARTQFYDKKQNKMSFKNRPVLVFAKSDSTDYVVLPVSTISIKTNINPKYDIKIEPTEYPLCKLKKTSYVRTHKQLNIHRAALFDMICDLRKDYEDLYLYILYMRDEFNSDATNQALYLAK